MPTSEREVNNSEGTVVWDSEGVKASVITLTPAPAIDRTYELGTLHPGGVHRATAVHSELAGKGVNVSSNLSRGGIASLAVVPLSPEEASSTQSEVIHPYPVSHPVRVNITLLEENGQTTKINEQAPPLSTDEWDGLISETVTLADRHDASWILVAGTIPVALDGSPLDLTGLFRRSQSEGRRVGLDTSGSPLLELARSGLPDVVKPNAPELAECVGRSLRTIGDVVSAAHEVHEWGVTHVLVSLGPDGMVGVSSSGAVHASTAPVTVRNTIGAGDASVAGFLSHFVSHPDQFAEAVGVAVAWGALKVQEVSSQLHSVEGLPEVAISTSPDLDRDLQEPGLI